MKGQIIAWRRREVSGRGLRRARAARAARTARARANTSLHYVFWNGTRSCRRGLPAAAEVRSAAPELRLGSARRIRDVACHEHGSVALASRSSRCLLPGRRRARPTGTRRPQAPRPAVIELATSVEKLMEVAGAEGEGVAELIPVATPLPGDEVVYTVTFTNLQPEAVENVRITSPIPGELRYIEGTAFGPGCQVLYSVDGGRTYGLPAELSVVAADGSPRIANAADYTHIRWVLQAPLEAVRKASRALAPLCAEWAESRCAYFQSRLSSPFRSAAREHPSGYSARPHDGRRSPTYLRPRARSPPACPGFTYREAQQRMAELVEAALETGRHAVIEAGTGIGKTFAYLLPVLLSGRRAIISTGTRTLQDQLFARDLPMFGAVIGRPVEVALLKGRNNYLCWHRLDMLAATVCATPLPQRTLQALSDWGRASASGDLTELADLDTDPALRGAITSTVDNCLGSRCSFFDQCFVLEARRRGAARASRDRESPSAARRSGAEGGRLRRPVAGCRIRNRRRGASVAGDRAAVFRRRRRHARARAACAGCCGRSAARRRR